MTFIKRISSLILLALFLTLPSATAYAQTDVFQEACTKEPDSTLCKNRKAETKENNSIYGPNGVLTKATNILLIVVGIAAVIMIIIGGLQYVLATGDAGRVNNAKNMVLYAIIGLVVAIFAKAILAFVLNQIG